MGDCIIICPNKSISPVLENMIKAIGENGDFTIIKKFNPKFNFTNKKIVFAVQLNELGFDIPMLNFIEKLNKYNNNAFLNSKGAVIIQSPNELNTKRVPQDLIYMANNLGCAFMGHPLVEATGSLNNFKTWQKVLNDLSLEEICYEMCKRLGKRLILFTPVRSEPKILVLYSTPHKKSNTLDFWNMIKKYLPNYDIKEIELEHGKIYDCKGCKYEYCIHFGERNSCFYGGVVVDEVLPSIEESNVIVWLCPNYNDAISANLTATINRLTVLYRKITFHNKKIFAIAVSGNSGSDSVIKQVLGALNINKGFILPPNFSIHATANDPNAIVTVPNIENIAKEFGSRITSQI